MIADKSFEYSTRFEYNIYNANPNIGVFTSNNITTSNVNRINIKLHPAI